VVRPFLFPANFCCFPDTSGAAFSFVFFFAALREAKKGLIAWMKKARERI
jgi:hypothetical protein